MLGYVFASFGVVFLIQWILSSLDALVAFFVSLESSSLLNYIFSLIPYPFAPGYLISAFFLEINYTPLLIITMGIGVSLFVLFTRTITLSTLESLKSITSEETLVSIRKSPEEKEREPIPIEVKKTSPLVAFIKKDLSIATKDIQTLMFFIIPILIPVISFISGMASAMNMASADPLTVLIPWSTIFFLGIFNSYLLISGFLNIEQSGSAILASLPIRERNQAKAKLGLIYPVQIIGYLLPALIIMRSPLFLPFLLILLCSLPFILAMTLLVMEIKVLLFGKLRFKYVLDEVKMENKTLKWVILIISGGGLGVMLVIMENMLAFILGFIPVLISLLIIGFLLLGILIYSFNRMFPIIE
jgi:predicted permease